MTAKGRPTSLLVFKYFLKNFKIRVLMHILKLAKKLQFSAEFSQFGYIYEHRDFKNGFVD